MKTNKQCTYQFRFSNTNIETIKIHLKQCKLLYRSGTEIVHRNNLFIIYLNTDIKILKLHSE